MSRGSAVDETWLLLLHLAAWLRCCSGLPSHHAVNPLSVVRDDGVNSRLFQLATLLPSIGSDAHRNAIVEQRTS